MNQNVPHIRAISTMRCNIAINSSKLIISHCGDLDLSGNSVKSLPFILGKVIVGLHSCEYDLIRAGLDDYAML